MHAERNAIVAAFERGISLHGLTMFCSTCPCVDCARWIVRAGLSAVFYAEDYLDAKGLDYLLASGVTMRKVGLTDDPRSPKTRSQAWLRSRDGSWKLPASQVKTWRIVQTTSAPESSRSRTIST
jgi:pyrimidine deaminase RibD-like protein